MTVEEVQHSPPEPDRRVGRKRGDRVRQTSVMTARLARDGSGDTPRRTIRVPDAEWDAAKAVADENGETLSDVIRLALRRYVARNAKRRDSSS